MASLPFLPVMAANSRFQPIYVRDLAKAIVTATLEPRDLAVTRSSSAGRR